MQISKYIRIAFVQLASIFCISKRSKVIFYHDIHSKNRYTDMSTPIELFKKHINIIKDSGYEIVSGITKEHGQIEICFDDAFLGVYENIDFLKKLNVPIHLFVVSSYLNRKNHIIREQLLELNQLELIKISSHTHTHKILNQTHKEEVEYEFRNSKKVLEDLIGAPVESVCYPEGKFNNRVIQIADQVGYKKQYSSIPSFFYDRLKGNVIGRSLVQFAGKKEFKSIIKGGDHIFSFWYKLKHFKK